MKKNVYLSPEVDVIELKYNKMLMASEIGGGGGEGFAPEYNPDEE